MRRLLPLAREKFAGFSYNKEIIVAQFQVGVLGRQLVHVGPQLKRQTYPIHALLRDIFSYGVSGWQRGQNEDETGLIKPGRWKQRFNEAK